MSHYPTPSANPSPNPSTAAARLGSRGGLCVPRSYVMPTAYDAEGSVDQSKRFEGLLARYQVPCASYLPTSMTCHGRP